MAVPHVAGVAALYLQDDDLDPEELGEKLLRDSTEADIRSDGDDEKLVYNPFNENKDDDDDDDGDDDDDEDDERDEDEENASKSHFSPLKFVPGSILLFVIFQMV